MKIFVLLIHCVGLFTNSFGQDYHVIDSLKQLLYTSSNDTIKGLAIRQLAQEYNYTKPDSCLYFTTIGLNLIKDYSIKKEFENSSLSAFENQMYRLSAIALSEQRNDSLAVRMALKSLELVEKSKGKYDIQGFYGGISEVYQNIGEPAIAISYIRNELALDTSEHYRTIWLASLGTCFFDLSEYDSALYYLRNIDPFFKISANKYWPFQHLYLGKIYVRKKEYQNALLSYRTSIDFAKQAHLIKDLGEAYLGIADAFKSMGNIDSALNYARQSLQISNELSLPVQSMNASIFLSSIYESKGLPDSAFKYQKIFIVLKDSLSNREKIKQVQNYTFNEKLRQQEIKEEKVSYQNKVRLYALVSGIIVLLLIAAILLRNNRHKQKLNSILQSQKEEIQNTLAELKSTQSQLIQSEKMASLGELTAGIAHEIENPLNFMNNFSEVNAELIDEMKLEIETGNFNGAKEIANGIKENELKISHHGKRADAILKGMLQHLRVSTGQKVPANINAIADECLRLSYHAIRAKDKSFNATTQTDFDKDLSSVEGTINIVPQDVGRVLLNLYNNAFYAVSEKKKQQGENYEPTVSISTKKLNDKVEIRVKDNGYGIPQKVINKIFQPFFTTKPTGQGTGLGLSLSYDIIKAHGGDLNVETKENEFAEFIITLPLIS